MIDAISKAMGQLGDPRMMAVVKKSLIGAALVSICLLLGLFFGLSQVAWTDIPYIGPVLGWTFDAINWVFGLFSDDSESITEGVTTTGLFIGVSLGAAFLFPPVMIAIMGIFLDEVCAAVEAKHYPGLGEVRFVPTLENILSALKFLGIVILINLLALPFYILTFWVAGLGLVLYYLINGYLFGREYYELVAHRRVEPRVARNLRRANRGTVMMMGCLAAFGMSIPIVNLIVPVIIAAAMVHVFMKLANRTPLTGQMAMPAKSETSYP